MSNNETNNGPENENKIQIGDSIFEPLQILGVSDTSGELKFLIHWKGTERSDMVPAKVAHVKWPQMVIKFYEDRLVFHPDDP